MEEKQVIEQASDVEVGQNKPPYVAFKTFKNFIESLRDKVVPFFIDTSVMTSMSGTNKILTMLTLKYFGLIDDQGKTNDKLRTLVKAEGDEWKRVLRDILTKSYPFLFENDFIDTATQRTFHEKFLNFGMTGSTIQKAEIFFLQAARDADIQISPYIKPTRTITKSKQQDLNKKPRRPKEKKPAEQAINSEENNVSSSEQNSGLSQEIVNKMVDKFPEFNPEWSKEAQEDWLRAFNQFYNTIKDKT